MLPYKKVQFARCCLAALALALAAFACNMPSKPVDHTPASPPGQTPVEAPTSLPASQTAPAAPTAGTENQMATIYLVAVGDNGASGAMIGCGDSLVAVEIQIPPTQAVLQAALTALLSLKQQYYGGSGLYNALYQSNLKVDKITLVNGKATVELSGQLLVGGECDDPRVLAQLEATAKQFSTVKDVQFILNGKPLEQVLSNR